MCYLERIMQVKSSNERMSLIDNIKKGAEIHRTSNNIFWKFVMFCKDICWRIKSRIRILLIRYGDSKANNFIKKTPFNEYSLLGLSLWGYSHFHKFLDKNEKINIPDGIHSIRIDVGLSHNAPNSLRWLSKIKDCIVFGFEPNPESVRKLMTNEVFEEYLSSRFHIFQLAIDDNDPMFQKFYMTAKDPGTSSLHKPNYFPVKESINVLTIRLSDFLELIPWDIIPFIEHLKIDTQGNDLHVLQSAGKYLDRIKYITAEFGTSDQYDYSHTESELRNFLESRNFSFVEGTEKGDDKTYLNQKFISEISKYNHETR